MGRTGSSPAGQAVGRALLVRDRLLERLRARWHTPVTVLVAPAGYGKSTLLAQAITANAAAPVGVERFVTCWPGMTAASSLGEALCRALGAAPASSGQRGVEEWVGAVVETVWRLSPQQVVVVLDDVHEIAEGSDAARLLETMAAALPANGHLVLSGRRPPPVRLVRLEVEDRVVTLDQTDLAFTDAEVAAFAELRGTPTAALTSCDGWPALAELLASTGDHGRADGPPSNASDYLGQEVLSHLGPDTRRSLGVLAYLGPFGSRLAEVALGPDVDVATLLDGLPLVGTTGSGEWYLHAMWQSLLERDLTLDDITHARCRAGLALLEQGRLGAGMRRLIDAELWEAVLQGAVRALSVVHPPVARDLVADWLERLPAELRASPAGRLMAAVASEGNPAEAIPGFEACRVAFQDAGDTAGEISCVVQLGRIAWWSDDEETLAAAVVRVFELEAAGSEEVVPLAQLGRALLFDMANDSHGMLAELDRILPGSLPDAWVGIERWMRAFGLLELGYAAEALKAAEAALADPKNLPVLNVPLSHTRLYALWYEGRAIQVLSAIPDLARSIDESGYQHHAVLMAGNLAVVEAWLGRSDRAAGHLSSAQAAGIGIAEAPLVDTALSLAKAAVAVVEGDEPAAVDVLTAYVDRLPLLEGIAAGPQRRQVALFYVLVPSTRPIWDRADLGPAWDRGRRLARAVVAARDGRELPTDTPALDDVGVVRAHLPPSWVAELALGAVADGRDDGWHLLDQTWPPSRPTVIDIAQQSDHPLGKAAKDALGRFPLRPDRCLRLQLLGPVELHHADGLVQHPDWRRERVRMLLAYLVLRPTVSRTELAQDLWPKLEPKAQSHNLRVTLSYLLQVLEPERDRHMPSYFVRRHGNNLTLHVDDRLTVDVWDFDTACARAEESDRRDPPAAALAHALEAVELWRSDPVELASEPWAIPLVEERRLRFATVAVRAGELLLAMGDTAHARALAARALEADPWLDSGHRLVVAGHHAAGNDLAARQALHRYRAAIHDLGLNPDEATLMVERLLDNLPDQAPPPGVQQAFARRPTRTMTC